MTTGFRLSEIVYRRRKRPKKTASNAKTTRKPFGDQPTKILPIPLFIDSYNRYMGGVDQANQLRAAFTTHSRRNLKEYLPGVFWCIDLVVTNSYKLYLAINDSKTTSNDNRDTNQHRNYIEDLVNLLFCIDSKDFSQKITEKPYPKYQPQSHQAGRKFSSNDTSRVENSENQLFDATEALESLFENHTQIKTQKRGYCVDCSKDSSKRVYLKRDLSQNDDSTQFILDSIELNEIEIIHHEERDRKRTKKTS